MKVKALDQRVDIMIEQVQFFTGTSIGHGQVQIVR